jgi:hypothetical protein
VGNIGGAYHIYTYILFVVDVVRVLGRDWSSCYMQKGQVDSENQHETLGAKPTWKTDMKLEVKYNVP